MHSYKKDINVIWLYNEMTVDKEHDDSWKVNDIGAEDNQER